VQAETHQQFIVHVREGSLLSGDDSAMQAALDHAGSRLRTVTGGVRLLRRMAVGPAVVRAGHPLDRAEAGAWMAAVASGGPDAIGGWRKAQPGTGRSHSHGDCPAAAGFLP